jgi:hypothetical protein
MTRVWVRDSIGSWFGFRFKVWVRASIRVSTSVRVRARVMVKCRI